MSAERLVEGNLTDYPPVNAHDPLARAVGLMVQHKCDVLPVEDGGRFVGVVREAALMGVLGAEGGGGKSVWEVTDLTVPRLPEHVRLEDVLRTVKDHPQEMVLPVVSEEGVFKGMVRPRDLLAEMMDSVRPARVGGMATPFGVYLHCGSARGGSSDWALLLTGSLLMLVVGAAWVLSFLVCWFVEKPIGVDLVPLLLGSNPLVAGTGTEVAARAVFLLPFLFFLVILRFTRVAQFHAAEHMVVHALERFEPLTEEAVARMGRVHPRCGSNLMVPLFILLAAWSLWPVASRLYFVGLLVLVVATGRALGGVAQALFTTRRPQRWHIERGIEAANQMLHNYRRRGRRPVPLPVRVWNMGMVQTLLGALLAYAVFQGLQALLRHLLEGMALG